jgi:hypothetical protein
VEFLRPARLPTVRYGNFYGQIEQAPCFVFTAFCVLYQHIAGDFTAEKNNTLDPSARQSKALFFAILVLQFSLDYVM